MTRSRHVVTLGTSYDVIKYVPMLRVTKSDDPRGMYQLLTTETRFDTWAGSIAGWDLFTGYHSTMRTDEATSTLTSVINFSLDEATFVRRFGYGTTNDR